MLRKRMRLRWVSCALVCLVGPVFAQPPPPDTPPADPPVEPAPPPETPPAPPPDPTPPAPPPPSVTAAPALAPIEEGYPRALTARPLILPQGLIEASALVQFNELTFDGGEGDTSSIDLYLTDLRVRYGVGAADFEAGAAILIADDVPEMFMVKNEKFRSAFINGRFEVQPDMAIGAQLTYVNVSDDAKIYQPRILVATKRRLTPRSAIEVGVSGGIDRV